MTEEDKDLLGYCGLHCRTQRALFHESHINRLLQLAGDHRVAEREWASYGPDIIEPLIVKARARDAQAPVTEPASR